MLDHVMIKVSSHVLGERIFERLGFKLRGVRGNEPMGGGPNGGEGGSNIAVLTSRTPECANYLEFSYADPLFASPVMRHHLGGDPGVAMLVFSSSDCDAAYTRWKEAGIAIKAPLAVTFPAKAGAAGQTMKIAIAEIEDAPIPCNVLQFATLAEFDAPGLRDHPNTAHRWTTATVVASGDAFERTCEQFSRRLMVQPIVKRDERLFENAGVDVRVLTSDAAESYFADLDMRSPGAAYVAALTVSVRSMDALKACLSENGVPFLERAGAVMVSAKNAGGVILEFKPA